MQRRTIAFGLLAGTLAALLSTIAAADTAAFVDYAVPTSASQPVSIVSGPDGALWFTEFAGNKIGRVTTDGVFREYPIPTSGARPDDLAIGPDGNLWFAETSGNRIGRITPSGAIDEFDNGLPAASRPTAVAPGPDGNVWFTERALGDPAGRIGRIDPSTGEITNYPLASNGHPLTITPGPDGALWFTESPGNRIGRIDPADGAISEYPVPTFQSAPWEITAGPDGNLWFTELNADQIGRIDPVSHTIAEYQVPTPASQPNTIRPGPDPNPADTCAYQRDTVGDTELAARYGSFGGCVSRLATTKTLWFSEQAANRLAQITTDGDVFEYPLRTAGSQPGGLAQGPDGAVWFTELAGSAIGRLDVKSIGKPAAPGTRSGNVPVDPLKDS